jgi:predicted glycosyltransferase
MQIKVEVIPWETGAEQFGISVQYGTGEAELYLVGTRLEAEREAKRLRSTVIIFPGPKDRRPKDPR